jgi:hypothetical protein
MFWKLFLIQSLVRSGRSGLFLDYSYKEKGKNCIYNDCVITLTGLTTLTALKVDIFYLGSGQASRMYLDNMGPKALERVPKAAARHAGSPILENTTI